MFYWLCINFVSFAFVEFLFQGVWQPCDRRYILGCDRNWRMVLENWNRQWVLFGFSMFLSVCSSLPGGSNKKNQNVHGVNIGRIATLGVVAIELKTNVLCLFVVVCCCVCCSGRSKAGSKNGREKFLGSIFHTDPFFTRVEYPEYLLLLFHFQRNGFLRCRLRKSWKFVFGYCLGYCFGSGY